ncbi:Hachiman antiphage defense system protein HamA [Megasphaera lornae]|nr:Hachiman antiphage defense system protein HamA [Megasphaera genomosp. type_1]
MMEGIIERKNGETTILEVQYLSEDLKKKIQDELVEICHGEYALVSGFNYHSFDETVKELVNHRIPSNINRKVGVIGELLLNVLIREFTDIKIVSPFFNLEERHVKKGFDIIAVDSNKDLWIIESKAGELGKLKTSTEKVCERINAAKRDLDTRLNMHNSQLWLNAVNSVRGALDDTSEKNTIVNILNKNSSSCSSNDKNVILGGTVFCIFNSTIDSIELRKLHNSILSSNKFSKLKLIAIQKQTYQAIIDFLVTLV